MLAVARFVATNELLPTHVIISGDLFNASCEAQDLRFVARDPTIISLKVGIDDDAPLDTIKVTKVLNKREKEQLGRHGKTK